MNIVIIAGSNRKSSSSTQLAQHIGSILQKKNHHVDMFDLHQSKLPFYSPDEANPEHTSLRLLKECLVQASAVVLASPEYHGSLSGVLKNALDHLGQEHFKGKLVLSLSSSGGPVGVSSLQQMHSIVRNLHGINCPDWISIGGSQRESFQSLETSTAVIDKKIHERIQRVTESFIQLAQLVNHNSIVV